MDQSSGTHLPPLLAVVGTHQGINPGINPPGLPVVLAGPGDGGIGSQRIDHTRSPALCLSVCSRRSGKAPLPIPLVDRRHRGISAPAK